MTPPAPRAHLAILAILCAMLLPLHRAAAALGTLDASFNIPATRLVLDPVRPRMYASITGSNCVAVIDTSTLRVITTVPVGSGPIGMAESADGSTLYVANSGSTTTGVSVIDLTSLQTVSSLPTPEEPSDIAVGYHNQLYLTPAGDDDYGIMQIDAATGVFQESFDDGGDVFVYGGGFLAVSPDMKTLYFGNSGISAATLASFDISTGTADTLQVNSTTVGSNGEDLELNHSGSVLCFPVGSGQNGYQIAEIPSNDIDTVNGYLATGAYPDNIAFSPDDTVAYTAPDVQDTLMVFNASTCALTGSFDLPGDAGRLRTDSSGKHLFVSGRIEEDADFTGINVYDTGRAAAVITSTNAAAAETGTAFSYNITASNGPTSYNATGLPAGLTVDTQNGLISGTATASGVYQAFVSASNAIGNAMADLTITVTGTGVTLQTVPLTVTVSGNGAVTNSLFGTTYQTVGSSVTISATAGTGYNFTGWTGAVTSSSNPLTLTITSTTSIQANFASNGFGTLVALLNIPAARFAEDPIRPRIYASITGSNSVAVIDTSTLSVVGMVTVGDSPVGLAVSKDGSTLYVANSGDTTNSITVINLATLQVETSLSTPVIPSDIAIGYGNQLYLTPATDSGEEGIMQVDAGTGNFQEQFTGGAFVYEGGFLAVSPDQKTLYFGNSGISGSTLASIDISSGTAVGLETNGSGENGEDLEISHNGLFVCYPNGGGQSSGYEIDELQASDIDTVNGSFDTGAYPDNIAFSPDDAFAYTVPFDQSEVRVFNTNTFTQTGSFSVPGDDAGRLIVDSSGNYLLVAALLSPYDTPVGVAIYNTGRLGSTITSATSAVTVTGYSFNYDVTATNSPTSYNASNLPPGLSIDTGSGIISGTTTTSGTWQAVVSASNAIGVAMGNLNITVLSTAPTAALTVTVAGSGGVTGGYLGTTYPAIGATISLTATAAPGSVFTSWSGGITSSSNPLVFVLESATSVQANFASTAAVVMSYSESSLNYGSQFSYQITASGIGPFTYGATGLPSGLTVNPSTGLISGSLGNAGNFNAVLTATNATTEGYGTGTLSLRVNAQETITAGAGGTASPAGVSYAPLNSSQTITAIPYAGYLFKDWTGPSTTSSNPLVFAMPVTAQWTANFVPATFYVGSYSGALSSGTPAVASSGMLVIKLLNTSVFTGYLEIAGVRYAIESDFSPSNSTQITIPRRGAAAITLYLTLGLTGGAPVLTGTATDGTWTSALSTSVTTTYTASAPCPRAGLYTLALSATAGPTGSGYATLSVSKAGVGTIVGSLADGTRYSATAPVEPAGTMAVYCPLYANKGGLAGSVTFESATSTGELTGTLNWWKPAGPANSAYPPAISTALQVAGSSYNRLAGLTGTGGDLDFSGGKITGTESYPFALTPPLKITVPQPGAHSVSFVLTPLSGVFGGTVLDGTKREAYHGVILQQQGTGAGYFTDTAGGGTVSVDITP